MLTIQYYPYSCPRKSRRFFPVDDLKVLSRFPVTRDIPLHFRFPRLPPSLSTHDIGVTLSFGPEVHPLVSLISHPCPSFYLGTLETSGVISELGCHLFTCSFSQFYTQFLSDLSSGLFYLLSKREFLK